MTAFSREPPPSTYQDRRRGALETKAFGHPESPLARRPSSCPHVVHLPCHTADIVSPPRSPTSQSLAPSSVCHSCELSCPAPPILQQCLSACPGSAQWLDILLLLLRLLLLLLLLLLAVSWSFSCLSSKKKKKKRRRQNQKAVAKTANASLILNFHLRLFVSTTTTTHQQQHLQTAHHHTQQRQQQPGLFLSLPLLDEKSLLTSGRLSSRLSSN